MENKNSRLISIEKSLELLKKGEMIILVDDEKRENEGDLVVASEKVTPEVINFMATHGKGLICISLTEQRCKELELPLMVSKNTSNYETPFTVSVDAHKNTTTGISAFDRAETIKQLIDQDAKGSDFDKPGHIFPLQAKKGGVLVRAGQTEGSLDLMRLAGMYPSGVICEIMKDDGTMARMKDLEVFSTRFEIPIVTIEDLIKYRISKDSMITLEAESKLPTKYGDFQIKAFVDSINNETHIALVKGDVKDSKEPVLTRVHSQCFTGDTLGSLKCDCGGQLQNAMSMIEKEGKGVILYLLNHEGRGIGLINKIKAYKLQEQGYDTVDANLELGFEADQRDYGIGAQILKSLGLNKLKLLTNNPAKYVALSGYGLEVVERIPLELCTCSENIKYMETKKNRMGHLLKKI